MKKGFLFMLVILLLPFVALAEDFDADVLTGEWFATESDLAEFAIAETATLEENGDIAIAISRENNAIIHPDGRYESPKNMKILQLDILRYNESILLYHIEDNRLFIYQLLIPTGEREYNAYFIGYVNGPSLFVNGKIYSSNSVNEYYTIGDTLYIIQEEGYIRGTITMNGNDFFSYEYVNSLDPFGEKLSQFFISADVINSVIEAERE